MSSAPFILYLITARHPWRFGSGHRLVEIARLRSRKASALLGKGYCQQARRAVRANIVAALTSIVLIGGVRVGLLRRTRFGQGCEEAVAALFGDLPASADKRLFSVDAGIATMEQFAAATEPDALPAFAGTGRLRKLVPACC